MRFQRFRIFTGILAVIIIIFTAMGVVFHIGTRYYVQARIQIELDGQIDKMKTGYYDEIGNINYNLMFIDGKSETYRYVLGYDSDEYYGYSDAENNTDIPMVYYENSYTEDNLVPVSVVVVGADYGRLDKEYDKNILLIKYCSEHSEMLNEEKYRRVKIKGTEYYVMVRNDIIDDEKTIFIITASPDELYQFVGKINVIFVVIMIVSAIILFTVSYRAGIRLERSRQKLKYYFQNASHELKTPIMSIQGFAEGIQTNIIKDHVRASQIIMSESDKMSLLIEEILLLSKMDSGYADMSREELNMTDILYDCVNMLEQEAEKRGIEFETDIDASKEWMLVGNEQQLERLFLNILSNAIRYARNTVKIDVQRNRGWIKIGIKDDGPGIRKKDMPHIFDRFYKGEGGQHGIGLAIAKEIVLLHKGRIKVSNDDGAYFCIWLRGARLR